MDRSLQDASASADGATFNPLLDAALEASGIGVWAWELDSGRLHWSRSQYELFGLPPHPPVTLERWRACLHPDDRAPLDALMRALLADPAREVRTEFRIVTPHGERWIRATGRLREHAGGRAIVGINVDVTARQRAERLLRENEARRRYLDSLAETLRPIGDAAAVQAAACRLLAAWLGVQRAFYVDVDAMRGELRVVQEGGDGPALPGVFRMKEFGWGVQAVADGAPLVVEDAAHDARVPRASAPAVRALGVGAFIAVPLVKGGRVVGTLNVAADEPRAWSADDVRAVQDTAERLWASAQRAQAEQELLRERQRLEIALRAGRMGVYEWRVKAGNVWWSPETYAAFGLAPGAFDGSVAAFDALVHPDDRAELWRRTSEAMAADGTFEHAYRIVRPDGEVRWLLNLSRVTFDAAGEPDLVIGIAQDITERRRVEDALKRSEAEFRNLAEVMPQIVVVAQADGTIEYVNAQWQLTTGETGTDAATLDRVIHPEDRAALDANWQRALARGEAFLAEFRLRCRPDGAWRWFLSRTVPIRDERGAIVRWYTTSTDIDVLKLTERMLRESQAGERERAALLQAVLDTSPAPIWISLDAQCERIVGNPAANALLGVDNDANVSRSSAEAPPYRVERQGVEISAAELPMQRAARTGRVVHGDEFEIVRADGTRAWLLMSASPLLGAAGTRGAVGVAVDITARRLSEAALRDSEALFRTIGEAVPDFLWMSDGAGRPIYQNPAWRSYTGMALGSHDPTGWQQLHHPDDRAAMQEVWQRALASGEAFEVEGRVRRHDGAYRWFSGRTVPLKDEHGTLVRWIGTMTDIHDLKTAEAALREADRRKDEFLATLAHELRNPLAPLRNGLHLLSAARDDAALRARMLPMMERQVTQLVRLVDDLLEVSRITRGKIDLQTAPVTLDDVVKSALETVRPAIDAARHHLTVRLPEPPVVLEGDAVRLSQVIVNLLANAAKYTDAGGTIELAAERIDGRVEIVVRDSGAGIPADMIPRVFELFTQVDRTLGRAQGGLGIGLALVKSLVELHGGTVQARSAGPGRGSEFVVRLPTASAAGAGPATADRPAARGELAGVRALVVDDNRDAADTLSLVLRGAGAEVRTAYDGASALALARTWRPAAAVLDLGMPGMDGYALAAALRAEPALGAMRLIALTGWGQARERQRALASGFDQHLIKPTDLEVLMASLRTSAAAP